MKKLFAIRHTSSKKPIPDLFFSDKMLAKRHRDELNKTEPGHVVTYGPDHRKVKEAAHE